MFKYPRTHHLVGSRLQDGDSAEGQVSVASLLKSGASLVWEEKVDGGNVGISFVDGRMMLQSRGHYLQGGARERQFDLFKQWAAVHEEMLYLVLGERYVMYGEWLYARHSVFYDALPHYFMEFDILDRERGAFLSTPARRGMLDGTGIVSVPVLDGGAVRRDADVRLLVRDSLFKTEGWRGALSAAAEAAGLDPAKVAGEGDTSRLAEGVYLKVERGDETVGRYKWIRRSFVQAILDDGVHWSQRPMVVNGLAPGVDLFAAPPTPSATPWGAR